MGSKQTPGGLVIPMHATLAGRVRWQVLDERGVPEIPRTPSGVAVGPAEGVEQPNLITDLGLNRMGAALNVFDTSTGSANGWRRRMAVGTGSTAPNVADTTLDNEVQRDASSGAFTAGGTTYELDTGDDVWRAVSFVNRVVTMTADRNLTEFGFAQATSADILIRELLRDGGGTPITVSLLNGKTLRVTHTLTVEIAAPAAGTPATINVEEYDAGNNLVASTPYDVVYGLTAGTGGAQGTRTFQIWNPRESIPTQASFGAAFAFTSPFAYQRIVDVNGANASSVATAAPQAYVNDSFEAIKRSAFGTGQANAALHTLGMGSFFGGSGSQTASLLIEFDDPATYTKANTDTLRVGIVSTWARA